MKENYTHLSLLVDRSGSMVNIQSDAQGGINSLIAEQAELDDSEITVSLYDFDNQYQKVFGPIAAGDAPEYNLVPRGSTALLDSAYKAIVDTGEWLASLSESDRPSKVIFAMVTDGGENASREISSNQLKEAITRQTETYNWEFLYLGANVDAFNVGSSIGVRTNTNYVASAASTSAVYSAMSSAVLDSRMSKGAQSIASAMPTNIDADGNATFDSDAAV